MSSVNPHSSVPANILHNLQQASSGEGILRSSSLPCRQSDPHYKLRLMKLEDVPEVLDVWKSIGLHEGTCTIQSFMSVDPEGFIVAEDEETGEILGMCAGVFVDPNVAFIGLYAVKPRFQGRGIGISIWNKLMADHIKDKNVGLYAVPEHLTTYRDKAGFRNQDSIQMLVYECDNLTGPGKGDLGNFCDDLVKSLANIDLIIIRPEDSINDELLTQLTNYDSSVTFVNRIKLLKATLKEKDTISLIAFEKLALNLNDGHNSLSSPGSSEPSNIFTLSQFINHLMDANCDMRCVTITGYIHMRTNNINKAMVGPLYANNDAIAELLMYQAINSFPSKIINRGILYMTHDSSAGGKRIADKLKLSHCEDLPRFFKKTIPKADFDRIYCIHTPNFSPY